MNLQNGFYSACASSAVLLLCLVARLSDGLECYVCKDQENNKDKCVETVKTCDIAEDRCLTEVRWGSTPYWAPSGEKQYYISKRCASAPACESAISATSARCDRIWFNDWECAECCHGDRCNYYVTLGSGLARSSALLFVTMTTLSTVLWFCLLRI